MSFNPVAEGQEWSARPEAVHWLLVTVALGGCAAVAEGLGTHTIRLGSLQIVILPLLVSFVGAMTINIVALRRRPYFAVLCQRVAATIMPWIVLLFVLRSGIVVGENLSLIASNGTAMVLQSIGKIGTIIAFPLAISLGMRREAIGATFSIGREPSLSIIQQRYGLGSSEMSGVLTTYITGTVLGAFFFSIIATVGSMLGYSTPALTMACGTGSGGMTFSCSGSLTQLREDMSADTILALATSSDVLSYVTTILLGTFLTIPLLERMTRLLEYRRKRASLQEAKDEIPLMVGTTVSTNSFADTIRAVFVVLFLISLLQSIGGDHVRLGTIILGGGALVGGTILIRLIPAKLHRIFPLPLMAAIAGVIASAPSLPWSAATSSAVAAVELLTLASGVLACAGMAINQQQLQTMKRFGWRAIVIAFFVFGGSYFVSATLAQLAL